VSTLVGILRHFFPSEKSPGCFFSLSFVPFSEKLLAEQQTKSSALENCQTRLSMAQEDSRTMSAQLEHVRSQVRTLVTHNEAQENEKSKISKQIVEARQLVSFWFPIFIHPPNISCFFQVSTLNAKDLELKRLQSEIERLDSAVRDILLR
jgi:hypothetical protein